MLTVRKSYDAKREYREYHGRGIERREVQIISAEGEHIVMIGSKLDL